MVFFFFCFRDSGAGGGVLFSGQEFFLFVDARLILLRYNNYFNCYSVLLERLACVISC